MFVSCAVCCLDRFYDRYSTSAEFGEYLADASLPLRAEIQGQGSCSLLDQPPSNHTNALLDSELNFVSGPFARMSRSYSRIDPTPTRGYQDILLFLALEDVQNFAALRTPLMSGQNSIGDRLRFFVGMAHIKTLRSDRLAVSSSQVEINADITSSYVYTTQTATDFTFIRDVQVSLSEVKRPTPDSNVPTAKFATITLIVRNTLTSTDAVNIIPPLALYVGVGFTANAASTPVYPCAQTYTGATKTDLDAMLLQQRHCALQDPICSAQGPVPVGPGGSIQFTFPLEDSTWNDAMLDADDSMRQSIYIDFMVSVLDQSGKRLVTNLKTSTVIKRTSVVSRCTDPELLASSISEILSVDIFLGLAGSEEQFDSSLVQSLDVTKRMPETLRRDISSTASNVMTVLVKGQPDMFEEHFARDYTLAVEDIITLHFLSKDKLNQATALINAGTAFTQARGLHSDLSIMHLVPSAELLNICLMQSIRNRFGCLAQREVKRRRIEFAQSSIINIAQNDASDLLNVSTAAGVWTSNLLGNSEYARQLGFNHSNIMNKKNNLNARYRRGFMISPTTPWAKREMDAALVTTPLDLAQNTITTILLTLDANIGESYQSTVLGGAPHVSNFVPSRRLLSSAPSAVRHVARMLMQLNSDGSSGITAAPQTTPNRNTAPTARRQITSVDDSANVVKTVCANSPGSHKCGMIRVTKRVSTAEFCLGEEAIMQGQQAAIDLALQRASDDALQEVHITSVSQKNRGSICHPAPGRRLLAAATSHDLIFTLVLEVRTMVDAFSLSAAALGAEKITAIRGLTNDSFWRLCENGIVTDDCVKTIAQSYNATRDIVVPFSLHIPDPAANAPDMVRIRGIINLMYTNNTRVSISAPIHIAGSLTTRFEVTISVPFLQTYGDEYVAAAMLGLKNAGFHPETTTQSSVVLRLAHADVNAIVLSDIRNATAKAYGVNIGKVKLTVLPDSMNGQTTVSIVVQTLWNETDVTHNVQVVLVVSMLEATFRSIQSQYVAAIASVAGVSVDKVAIGAIVTVSTSRRLLAASIQVPFTITVSSAAAGATLAGGLSVAATNTALSSQNQPPVTFLAPASTASAVSAAAQQLQITRSQSLDGSLVALNLKQPSNAILYIDTVVTIDGEATSGNSNTVILLYLLLAFLIFMMIAGVFWGRRAFGDNTATSDKHVIDYNAINSYDAGQHGISVPVGIPVENPLTMDPSKMFPMMHHNHQSTYHYR